MTFYIFRNWILEGSSELPITSEWCKTFYKEYTPEELKALELGATVDENGDVEITPEIELKIELAGIEERFKGSKERYAELKEMWEMRSNTEEIEFQALETGKNTLLARRKEILDSL